MSGLILFSQQGDSDAEVDSQAASTFVMEIGHS